MLLKQLQVLPDGSPREVTQAELRALLKSQKNLQRWRSIEAPVELTNLLRFPA
jgi:hypothetical protein